MNMARGINRPSGARSASAPEGMIDERPIAFAGQDRRMQVRAYNHWVSLLRGRPCPTLADLDPASIADFGPNSVLLDFGTGTADPAIRFLGAALAAECGVTASIAQVSDAPETSLLSRLAEPYAQIIENRAPIGFETEFVGPRGNQLFYRGLLMPFADDQGAITCIYGVINWKEAVDVETQTLLAAEIDASQYAASAARPTSPPWPKGTADSSAEPPRAAQTHRLSPLADQLLLAQESAATVRASDLRRRAALHRTLNRAYGFALAAEAHPADYAALLEDAGLTPQSRAPMTPIVKLIFGAEYDKTRLAEFAAVLAHARRLAVPEGGLDALLESTPGGVKGIVQAERKHRADLPHGPRSIASDRAAESLRSRPPLGRVQIPAGEAEFVLLLARAGAGGLDIVAKVEGDAALTDRAMRRAGA